jgi:hypothetical protein
MKRFLRQIRINPASNYYFIEYGKYITALYSII